MAKREEFELQRCTAPKRSAECGQKGGQQVPARESKENRQFPFYQSDPILRELQFNKSLLVLEALSERFLCLHTPWYGKLSTKLDSLSGFAVPLIPDTHLCDLNACRFPPGWPARRRRAASLAADVLSKCVLGRQVLILQQELLVNQSGHVGQKPRACGCVGAQRPS
jgi:hypothetical protein